MGWLTTVRPGLPPEWVDHAERADEDRAFHDVKIATCAGNERVPSWVVHKS